MSTEEGRDRRRHEKYGDTTVERVARVGLSENVGFEKIGSILLAGETFGALLVWLSGGSRGAQNWVDRSLYPRYPGTR